VHSWHYSFLWKLWPGKNRVVYMAPVAVDGLTLAQLPELKERVHRLMTAELEKYSK